MKRKRTAQRALFDLQLIKLRLAARLPLDETDSATVIELIDAIIEDADPRNKYYRTVRGAPEKDWDEKFLALMAIAINTTPPKPPDDELLEKIAVDTGLSFDALKHAYRKYLLPTRVALTKKRSASKGDK
jgi:hypothetical protein